MNFEVHVISASNIPPMNRDRTVDPFVDVFQDTLYNHRVGFTKAHIKSSNPTWNEKFPFHAIRGVNLRFEILDYEESGRHQFIGKAVLNPGKLRFGTPITLNIVTYPGVVQIGAPSLTIQIIKLADKPTPFPNSTSPIPPSFSIYASISTEQKFIPNFPISKDSTQQRSANVEMEFIAFRPNGTIKTMVTSADPVGISSWHSGPKELCYCYDTYGDAIKFDPVPIFFQSGRRLPRFDYGTF